MCFQANGVVPTISIDKTDGTQIYLNEKSLGTQIITAKSSEMNVCITKPNGDLVSKIKSVMHECVLCMVDLLQANIKTCRIIC